MGMVVPLAWLALGMTVPLTGTVVDGQGRPVAGASVWLADTIATREGPDVLAGAETDEQGRFRLDRADDLAGRGAIWSPTLWAYKPGARVASVEFKRKVPAADEPVKLVLGPPASTTLRILRADGQPAMGARAKPVPISLKAPRPPDKLLDRLAVTADAEGRVTLEGFDPAELQGADVAVEGQVDQFLPIDADEGTVTIRATGRLKVRVVADDPKAVQGWKVTVTIRPAEAGYRGPYATQWADEVTGADGRADYPPLVYGSLFWNIEPPAGSDYLAAKLPSQRIAAGATAEVEIPIRRGVRVEGILLEEPGGAPIAGVKVDVDTLVGGSRGVRHVSTDSQGRFSKVIPPGRARFRFSPFDMPKNYFLSPDIQHWADFEVREGEARHTFDPPRLRKAAVVRGRVVDAGGAPVAGANVSYTWASPEFGRNPNTNRADADARGEFDLGGIAPGAEVRVAATLGPVADSEPVVVPSAGEGGPITLQLRTRPTLAIAGRVLGEDGRPLPDLPIRVKLRDSSRGFGSESDFDFEGASEVRTGPDGRFRTPERLPEGHDYSVEVRQAGFDPSASRWAVAPSREVPDLIVRRSVGRGERAGRVVDSAGRPIAGVEVFQSGDGPKRNRGTTDADGRFRVRGVPQTPAILFASKDGYRFLGRRVDPGDREVEFALRRLDEPPSAPLRPAEAAVPRDEERAIARALIADARREPLDWDSQWRREIPKILAMIDPDRALAMVEDQVIAADADLLAAIALGRSEEDPRKVLELFDSIDAPYLIAEAGLALSSRIGPKGPAEVRRGLLERAERAGRQVVEAGHSAGLLARIADRWFDLGDPDRGAKLAREAQALAARPRDQPSTDPGDELALALARVDLPSALKLVDGRDSQQSGRLDYRRVGIAARIGGTQPAEARRLIGQIEPDYARSTARREVAVRLAAKDLAAARSFAAEDRDPIFQALLPAIAAQGRADADPDGARALLLEAVERLAAAEVRDYERSPAPGASPAVALARLLPLACRLDPDRAPSYFWLALSRRSPLSAQPEPRTIMPWHRQHYVELAELASLAARFDRRAAEVVFAPVSARLVGLHDDHWGLGNEGPALFRAAGAYDARVARRLLDALPADPPRPDPNRPHPGNRQTSKAQSRTALAEALALPPGRRLRKPSEFVSRDFWLEAIDD